MIEVFSLRSVFRGARTGIATCFGCGFRFYSGATRHVEEITGKPLCPRCDKRVYWESEDGTPRWRPGP